MLSIHKLLTCCLLLGVEIAFCFQAGNSIPENFRLVKDAEDIKVYHKVAPRKGYIEYKATTVVNEPNMENVLNFFMDYENHTQWVYNCIESKMWQEGEQTYLYQVCKSPWPFKDRDLSLLVKKTKLNNSQTIIDFISKPGATADHKKNVRINEFESRWLVRQIENKVSVTVLASFDPKLSLGSFMLKSYATKIPFETLKNLKAVYHLKM